MEGSPHDEPGVGKRMHEVDVKGPLGFGIVKGDPVASFFPKFGRGNGRAHFFRSPAVRSCVDGRKCNLKIS
jgi:hypothetical protein